MAEAVENLANPFGPNVIDAAERFGLKLDASPPLKGGGGGGTFDGMEPRIAALEAHMAHVQTDVAALKADVKELRTDVSAIKADVSVLKVKIDHLPSKEYISGQLAKWLGIVIAVTTVVTIGAKYIH